MKLYIVDFMYWDIDQVETIEDRWIIASESTYELEKLMKHNFKVFEQSGYTPISYSSEEISETYNGYEISVN
jgi:hypothetical protein